MTYENKPLNPVNSAGVSQNLGHFFVKFNSQTARPAYLGNLSSSYLIFFSCNTFLTLDTYKFNSLGGNSLLFGMIS